MYSVSGQELLAGWSWSADWGGSVVLYVDLGRAVSYDNGFKHASDSFVGGVVEVVLFYLLSCPRSYA